MRIQVPNLFLIVGQPDNGKTTISKWFKRQLDCEVIHTDQLYYSWIEDNYPKQLHSARQNIRGHYPRMTSEWRREWQDYAAKIILAHIKRAKLDLVVEGWLMLHMPEDIRKELDKHATIMTVHMRRYSAYAAHKSVRPKGHDYTNSVKSLCNIMSKVKGVSFMRKLVKYQSFEDIRDFQGTSDSCGKLIAMNLPPRMDGLSVLDVGCSTGYFAIRCAQRGAAVIGIDRRHRCVEAAARLSSAVYRLPAPAFIHGDFFTADFEQQFDYVLAINFLSRLGDKIDLFFKRVDELLKPGGTLVLEMAMATQSGRKPRTEIVMRDDKQLQYLNEAALVQYVADYNLEFIGRSVRMRGERRRRVYHFTKPVR